MFKIVSLQLRAILVRGAGLYRLGLLAGMGVFVALTAGLFFQALTGAAGEAARANRMLAAIGGNGVAELGFFGAMALGFCYAMFDLLGAKPAHAQARLRLAAEVMFALAALAALLRWRPEYRAAVA
ncbi:MAG: hypothetical protein U0Z44_05435 [Kouleothrix sp.]